MDPYTEGMRKMAKKLREIIDKQDEDSPSREAIEPLLTFLEGSVKAAEDRELDQIELDEKYREEMERREKIPEKNVLQLKIGDVWREVKDSEDLRGLFIIPCKRKYSGLGGEHSQEGALIVAPNLSAHLYWAEYVPVVSISPMAMPGASGEERFSSDKGKKEEK